MLVCLPVHLIWIQRNLLCDSRLPIQCLCEAHEQVLVCQNEQRKTIAMTRQTMIVMAKLIARITTVAHLVYAKISEVDHMVVRKTVVMVSKM